MSNKERIQRQAMEAAARERESAQKKAAKVRTSETEKKKAKRLKVVWAIFEDGFKEVGRFPYPEKAVAEAQAAQLTETSGKQHLVRPVKVPADDD